MDTNGRMRLETITPDEAAAMLRRNTRNRPLRQSVVRRYAQQMQEGLWKVTGDSIKLAADGSLLDGQHRLAAGMLAKVAFQAYVIRGLSPEVFDVLDTGVSRRPADMLHVKGEVNSNALAAVLAWLFRLEHGALPYQAQGARMSPHAALELLERHPGIRQFVTAANRVRSPVLGRSAINAFCHYVFALQDQRVSGAVYG